MEPHCLALDCDNYSAIRGNPCQLWHKMFVHSFVRLGKEFFGSCHLIVKIKPDDLTRLNVTSFLFVHSQYSNVFPTFIHDLKPLIISILLILHNRRLFHLKGLTRMPETLKLAPKKQTVTNFNDG